MSQPVQNKQTEKAKICFLLTHSIQYLSSLFSFVNLSYQVELALWYACIDALVLPSLRNETWSLVVNEAGIAGKPAIVSDTVGCWPDLIMNGVTGFVFKGGDADGLARFMREISSDKTKLAQMGDAMQALVRQKYSFDADVRALLEVASE